MVVMEVVVVVEGARFSVPSSGGGEDLATMMRVVCWMGDRFD